MSVEQRGSVWRGRVRTPGGKQVQRTFETKTAAKRWERAQLASIDRGDWIDMSLGATTFASYAETWLRHQAAGRRASTITQVESRLRLHVIPVLGAKPLARIRRSDCQDVITRAAQTLSPGTVRVVKVAMRAVLQSAVDDRMIPSNPALRLTVAAAEQTISVLSGEQVATIVERIQPELRAMVIVGLGTGLRSAELRALRIDRLAPRLHLAGEVVPSQCTIVVDAAVTTKRTLGPVKTSSSNRTITVSASVVEALREHLATYGPGPDGLVFVAADGRPLSSSMASDAWRRATRGMDLPPRCGFHSLRHYHASQLLAGGVNVAAVAARLGHASPAITLRTYSHVVPGDEARILDLTEQLAARRA